MDGYPGRCIRWLLASQSIGTGCYVALYCSITLRILAHVRCFYLDACKVIVYFLHVAMNMAIRRLPLDDGSLIREVSALQAAVVVVVSRAVD